MTNVQLTGPIIQVVVVQSVADRAKQIHHVANLAVRIRRVGPFQLGEHGVLGRGYEHVDPGQIDPLSATEFGPTEGPVLSNDKVDLPTGAFVDDVELIA